MLMDKITLLTEKMIAYNAGDRKRINHFLKVTAYARTIGELEGMQDDSLTLLTAAALTHDIGIKVSLEKYGNCSGEHQQIEGPPIAERMLTELGFSQPFTERVCWLIAHHHTYTDIEGLDYQILVEADFLVNLDEDNEPLPAVRRVREKIFRTAAGIRLLEQLFPEA
jgi:HD superfamily phosphodiesterase